MNSIDIAKPRPRQSGEARQQQIVETVLYLVAEHGADGVSVQAIADRIGLTQPAVFRHYPSKEAIWVAVMTWLEEQLGAIHQAADASFGESPLTILKHMFTQHVRMVERHPALAKIFFSDHLRLQSQAYKQGSPASIPPTRRVALPCSSEPRHRLSCPQHCLPIRRPLCSYA